MKIIQTLNFRKQASDVKTGPNLPLSDGRSDTEGQGTNLFHKTPQNAPESPSEVESKWGRKDSEEDDELFLLEEDGESKRDARGITEEMPKGSW